MTDFSSLKRMILPLFLEQLLVALVGIADVFVVGFVGEAAVSGVSAPNTRVSTAGRALKTAAPAAAKPSAERQA